MESNAHRYLNEFIEWHGKPIDQVDAVLGDDARLLEWSIDVAFGVRDAVPKHYPAQAFQDSLVGWMLLGLHNHVAGMAADFCLARYGEIRRTLRFVWELFFRAFHVDHSFVPPPDFVPEPCATVVAKLQWLEDVERSLNWTTGILPILESFFTDQRADLERHFHPLWNRLNALVHGSASAVWSGFGDSGRHVFDYFDEEMARELVDDAREVLALVFMVVIRSFPAVVPSLRDIPRLLQTCPHLRAQFD